MKQRANTVPRCAANAVPDCGAHPRAHAPAYSESRTHAATDAVASACPHSCTNQASRSSPDALTFHATHSGTFAEPFQASNSGPDSRSHPSPHPCADPNTHAVACSGPIAWPYQGTTRPVFGLVKETRVRTMRPPPPSPWVDVCMHLECSVCTFSFVSPHHSCPFLHRPRRPLNSLSQPQPPIRPRCRSLRRLPAPRSFRSLHLHQRRPRWPPR